MTCDHFNAKPLSRRFSRNEHIDQGEPYGFLHHGEGLRHCASLGGIVVRVQTMHKQEEATIAFKHLYVWLFGESYIQHPAMQWPAPPIRRFHLGTWFWVVPCWFLQISFLWWLPKNRLAGHAFDEFTARANHKVAQCPKPAVMGPVWKFPTLLG